jgi:low temperature requirement protein LtrA
LKPIEAIITLLTIEKTAQHLISAIAFIVDVPGVGQPDIGPYFTLSNEVMASLSLIYFALFLVGLLGEIRRSGWAFSIVGGLAALDILLEVIFHGLFYVTVSVIVSTLLIVAIIYYRRKSAPI